MVSTLAAKPVFFVAVVALVLVWLAVGPWAHFSHGWIDALQIGSAIITVALVVVLENEQWRNAKATQRKLNAIADALAHILATDHSGSEQLEQLRAAVGLEKRESISD